jgi:hypothetical protein
MKFIITAELSGDPVGSIYLSAKQLKVNYLIIKSLRVRTNDAPQFFKVLNGFRTQKYS